MKDLIEIAYDNIGNIMVGLLVAFPVGIMALTMNTFS